MLDIGEVKLKKNFVFDSSKVKLAKDLCVGYYDHDDIYDMINLDYCPCMRC